MTNCQVRVEGGRSSTGLALLNADHRRAPNLSASPLTGMLEIAISERRDSHFKLLFLMAAS